MDGSWQHFAMGSKHKALRRSEGKAATSKVKTFSWTKEDGIKTLTCDLNPSPFFRDCLQLRARFDAVLQGVVKSFRNYNYERISPIIAKSFGNEFVGVEGSGIEALFAVPSWSSSQAKKSNTTP